MSQAQPMTGADIKGYRTLTETDKAAMNRIKDLSRAFCAELDALAANGEYAASWLAVARNNVQLGCMAACRAVARPDEDC